jgi:hypothetical protein
MRPRPLPVVEPSVNRHELRLILVHAERGERGDERTATAGEVRGQVRALL